MSEIKIERAHELGLDEARRRVHALETKLKERYGVKLNWQGDRAEVKGTGVSGSLSIADKSVAINLKLGLVMRPLSGQIREAMERQLDKALA